MKIMMVTNTFTPHVGGVARSVQRFTDEYRNMGHEVLVVAPTYREPTHDVGTIRIPAFNDINGSSFSLPIPVIGDLKRKLAAATAGFDPDVIHSHHPFLLGDVARILSVKFRVPLVFTHHTMYEQFAAYTSKNLASPEFVMGLATEYANLCDHVIAPSQSTADILKDRGVSQRMSVVPTGVDVESFARGDRRMWRDRCEIPMDAPVIGHVGRLAPEKNLGFLTRAVRAFLRRHTRVHFLLVGDGPSKDETYAQLGERCHAIGSRNGHELASAFCAMDCFAFSSKSETQGMVLTEAMSAGVPVVAIDAPGARDVVVDRMNGRLVPDDMQHFCNALRWVLERKSDLSVNARRTAMSYSQRSCADKALAVYESTKFGSKKIRMLHAIASRITR